MPVYDVLVVGGGIATYCTALAVSQASPEASRLDHVSIPFAHKSARALALRLKGSRNVCAFP